MFVDFVEFRRSCGVKVIAKETFEAIRKETIRFVSIVNNERSKIALKDVWFVPGVTRNLFSVLAARIGTANANRLLRNAGLKSMRTS